jgi:hypothetical protein
VSRRDGTQGIRLHRGERRERREKEKKKEKNKKKKRRIHHRDHREHREEMGEKQKKRICMRAISGSPASFPPFRFSPCLAVFLCVLCVLRGASCLFLLFPSAFSAASAVRGLPGNVAGVCRRPSAPTACRPLAARLA